MDGQGVCGYDSIGNPCTAGRIEGCVQAKTNPRHKAIRARNDKTPMIVSTGFDYHQLAAFVPMCGGGRQASPSAFALPPAKLTLH